MVFAFIQPIELDAAGRSRSVRIATLPEGERTV